MYASGPDATPKPHSVIIERSGSTANSREPGRAVCGGVEVGDPRSRVTPVEGRDLSWKLTQKSDEGREIGDEPSNSSKYSEVTDGVTRESEGIA